MNPLTADRTDFRLITFGRVALLTPSGEDGDLAKRRRKLGLLAVLVLSRTPLTRAELSRMFWGDEDPDRARHSLSDALSDLRRVLGRDAISSRREIVTLDGKGRVSVDALDLEAAFDIGDFATVRRLYRGEFLSGLAVQESASFDTWVTEQRSRYASMHAVAVANQSANAAPDRDNVAAPGTVARRSWHRQLTAAVIVSAVAIALIGFGIAGARQQRPGRAESPIPVVALTDVFTDPADTSLAWLSEGLKQMIAADLDRVSSVRVVAPAVVREAAFNLARTDSLSRDARLAVARQLHADWAASGSISHTVAGYVATISVADVAERRPAHRYVVTGANILAVADQAAAQMLSALNARGNGPQLAEFETRSTEAYRHFIQSEALRADGHYDEQLRELDAAIAADSGFTSAIVARMIIADAETFRRLGPLYERARPRMTPWDRLSIETFEADHSGDPKRAERAAREAAALYPRDPRSIRTLAEVLTEHAEYQAAETTYSRLLALDDPDSLSNGPCWACEAYLGLTNVRQMRGDLAGEVDAARRWTALRPAARGAWLTLANALELSGDFRAAEPAFTRYRQLLNNGSFDQFTGRMLVMSRRYDEAEEYARRYLTSGSASDAYDLLQTVQRERGEFRAAIQTFDTGRAARSGLELLFAHTLGSVRDDAQARLMFERTWHPPTVNGPASMFGTAARGFAWSHALEADAVWEHADTVWLHALADSVQRIGAFSSYARDWTLFHHIRGLIAERGGRLEEARHEFEEALSLVHGFTRTNVELARVDLALGAPARALDVLRRGYHEPLDAMGRYSPRSEMDYEMALAFAGISQADSARTYASYVRAAWVHADPQFARRLALLP